MLAGAEANQRKEAVKQKAIAETERGRARSAMKSLQLLRVELVGKTDPQAGWVLLHDEEVYPTVERDFPWGLYNRWCQRQDKEQGLESATLNGHTGPVRSVPFNAPKPGNEEEIPTSRAGSSFSM